MHIQQRIADVLAAEADAIRSVEVTSDFEQAVLAVFQSRGKVLTTGMGKAGFVARKFAATLCSTGTPAMFLHPGEAAHGDLGLVAPGDLMIAFSTSGKTREVLELLVLGRQLGLETVIGVTSHRDSALRNQSDIVLDMGPVREPCALGLTPTASIAVMLAMSDALALVLLEMKQFTSADYGKRHHGGYLGRLAHGRSSRSSAQTADWDPVTSTFRKAGTPDADVVG